MDILKSKYTQTTYFLVPLLFSEDIKSSQIINDNFVNAFVADFNKKQYDDKIILVYSEKADLPAKNKVDEYKDETRRMFVYELPEAYQDDYANVLKGYWSKLSKDAKERILSFWEETEDSFIHGVLYHTPNKYIKSFYKKYTDLDPVKDLKKDEFWYKPNLVIEVLGL